MKRHWSDPELWSRLFRAEARLHRLNRHRDAFALWERWQMWVERQ